MKRKRFIKLMRALNATMAEIGYKDKKSEMFIKALNRQKVIYVRGSQINYQDLWDLNRDVKWNKYLEWLYPNVEMLMQDSGATKDQIEDAKVKARRNSLMLIPIFRTMK